MKAVGIILTILVLSTVVSCSPTPNSATGDFNNTWPIAPVISYYDNPNFTAPIINIMGSGSGTTPVFNITSTSWIVRWSCYSLDPAVNGLYGFYLCVHPSYVHTVGKAGECTAVGYAPIPHGFLVNDSVYVFSQPGQYCIDVDVTAPFNSSSCHWELIIW